MNWIRKFKVRETSEWVFSIDDSFWKNISKWLVFTWISESELQNYFDVYINNFDDFHKTIEEIKNVIYWRKSIDKDDWVEIDMEGESSDMKQFNEIIEEKFYEFNKELYKKNSMHWKLKYFNEIIQELEELKKEFYIEDYHFLEKINDFCNTLKEDIVDYSIFEHVNLCVSFNFDKNNWTYRIEIIKNWEIILSEWFVEFDENIENKNFNRIIHFFNYMKSNCNDEKYSLLNEREKSLKLYIDFENTNFLDWEESESFYDYTFKNLYKWTIFDFFKFIEDYHEQDCCENVYCDFEWIKDYEEEFNKLNWIKKVRFVWVEWMWFNVFFYSDSWKKLWVFIPARNSQNWYYSSNLTLKIKLSWILFKYRLDENWFIENC